MKRWNQGLFWAIFLLLAGLFLLLQNLAAFGVWGQAAWGGLFGLAGLIFLFSFIIDPQHWWRAIPGFVLLSIGAVVLLEWQNVRLGYWRNSLILFGMALAFWVVLLGRRENWWAEVPAGVLTVVGVLLGLQGTWRPDSTQWLVALCLGLGLVFALLYVLRLGERETWWPAVPAAALILFAVVTLIGPLGPEQSLLRLWPIALLVLGLVVFVLSIQRLPAAQPRSLAGKGAAAGRPASGRPAPAAPDLEAAPPARGAAVTHIVPDADLPLPPERPPRATEEVSPDQLYDFLKSSQPPEAPAGDDGK